MNAPETREINLWTCTVEEEEEWQRQQEKIRAKVAASPKFQYGKQRSENLLDILLSTPRLQPAVSSTSIDIPTWRLDQEKWQDTFLFRSLLESAANSYHIEKRITKPRFDTLLDRRWRRCFAYLNEFRMPFRIGSALALYENMDRAGRAEPSLSKAHWLLTKAPDIDGIPRTGFGSPDDIARAWKHCYHFAHYWAAYVAMIGEPFSFAPETLIMFTCKASLGRFRRLAATYLEFRREVVPPRSKQKGYISLGLDDCDNVHDIADVPPIARELLPNLLNAEQWRILDGYRAPVRKSRA